MFRYLHKIFKPNNLINNPLNRLNNTPKDDELTTPYNTTPLYTNYTFADVSLSPFPTDPLPPGSHLPSPLLTGTPPPPKNSK
jgi:hypothetical protein